MTKLCVVADAGPIIHLDELDALSLFTEFDEVYIPETVYAELKAGGVPEALDELNVTRSTVDHASDAFPNLDPGETAALTLCADLDAILLTDDLAARETASNQGLEAHGSIGIILLAYSRGSLSAGTAKRLIRGLKRDSSLYLSDPLVEYGIRLIEKGEIGWSDES